MHAVPGYVPPVCDDDLKFMFANFPRLRRLTLLQCNNISEDGAATLIAHRDQLERLEFVDNWSISQDVVRQLEAAFVRPNHIISIQGESTPIIWAGPDSADNGGQFFA